VPTDGQLCPSVCPFHYATNGSLEHRKAQWVIHGFKQQPGIDFDQTFSPSSSWRCEIGPSTSWTRKMHSSMASYRNVSTISIQQVSSTINNQIMCVSCLSPYMGSSMHHTLGSSISVHIYNTLAFAPHGRTRLCSSISMAPMWRISSLTSMTSS
jgi:hypothetical protein